MFAVFGLSCKIDAGAAVTLAIRQSRGLIWPVSTRDRRLQGRFTLPRDCCGRSNAIRRRCERSSSLFMKAWPTGVTGSSAIGSIRRCRGFPSPSSIRSAAVLGKAGPYRRVARRRCLGFYGKDVQVRFA